MIRKLMRSSMRRPEALAAIIILTIVCLLVMFHEPLTRFLLLPPRPVFTEVHDLLRWEIPYEFVDRDGNIFLSDSRRNLVLVVLASSPLQGKVGSRDILATGRPDSILFKNYRDPSIQLDLALKPGHCYFVGEGLKVDVVPMPRRDVGSTVYCRGTNEGPVRVPFDVVEELQALGVAVPDLERAK